MSQVWERLGESLKGMAREQAKEVAPRYERYKVVKASPLMLDQIDGDDVLEEGDEDFSIADSVREYRARWGLDKGDVVRVLHDRGEWTATDVESDRELNEDGEWAPA